MAEIYHPYTWLDRRSVSDPVAARWRPNQTEALCIKWTPISGAASPWGSTGQRIITFGGCVRTVPPASALANSCGTSLRLLDLRNAIHSGFT